MEAIAIRWAPYFSVHGIAPPGRSRLSTRASNAAPTSPNAGGIQLSMRINLTCASRPRRRAPDNDRGRWPAPLRLLSKATQVRLGPDWEHCFLLVCAPPALRRALCLKDCCITQQIGSARAHYAALLAIYTVSNVRVRLNRCHGFGLADECNCALPSRAHAIDATLARGLPCGGN